MQTLISADGSSGERRSNRSGNSWVWKHLAGLAVTRPIAVLEVIVGMVVVIGGCYLFQPADPLLLDISFPWIWLAATIFALRYGALLGVLAGLCVLVAWLLFYGQGDYSEFPSMLFVGGMVQLVLTGHFCDVWTNRVHREKSVNEYLENRLVAITNNHYLLRISHERLEKDLLAKPSTLRDAVGHLRELSAADNQRGVLPNVQAVLEFAALSCQIGEASIFPVIGHEPSSEAVAFVGEQFELDARDPLVHECLETHTLVHLRQLDGQESAFLACVPILSSVDRVVGVLVVRRMPFLSLNFDNLQLLRVLINYYADGIEQRELVRPVQRFIPECPYDFALELGRLAHMQRVSGVQSSLVALVIPRGPVGDSLFDQTVRYHRALDLAWSFGTETAQVSMVILPLADEYGVEGYLLRIESNFRSQFGTDFAQAHVASHRTLIDSESPGEGLQQFLLRCGYHA